MNRSRRRSSGFTLVEVMIVVAIIGILAAVAYPSYRDSVFKGRRATARAALAELMQQQERYMTQRGTYLAFSNTAGATVPTGAATTFKVYTGDNPTNPQYWLSATTCTNGTIADCVSLTATPTQADPQVDTLTITSTGTRSCTGSLGSAGPANSPNFKACWP